jgi:peroxiredoxin
MIAHPDLPNYLPQVNFYLRERNEKLSGDNPYEWSHKNTFDLFHNKRVVIIGLPGAFTPTCTNNQLPGFEEIAPQLFEKGIDEIWCTAVNDAFVMHQWSKHLNLKHIKMLPDGNADFARDMNMLHMKRNLGFGYRSWRYVAVVNSLEVTHQFIEHGWENPHPIDPYIETIPQKVSAAL